jgi:hypothetical protein
LEVIYLKKIKLFFVRNYQRFIRFLISLSAVSALVFGQAFSAGAVSYYDCVYAQPQLTGTNCYLEVVFSSTWKWLVTVEVTSLNNPSVVGDVSFNAFLSPDKDYLRISADVSSVPSAYFVYGFYVDMVSGNMVKFETYDNTTVQIWIGSAGTVTGIHGYNCNVAIFRTTTANDFSIRYGSDASFANFLSSISSIVGNLQYYSSNIDAKTSLINNNLVKIFNQNKAFFGSTNMDQILKAIQDNKSSAEKNEYSGATTDQKQAQSDLDTSEKKINEETAEARSTTINIFKNFSIVGDISKGLLSVTNLFNDLCLRFSPSAGLLNFSLAIGIGAFLLGVSAYVISKVVHRGGK